MITLSSEMAALGSSLAVVVFTRLVDRYLPVQRTPSNRARHRGRIPPPCALCAAGVTRPHRYLPAPNLPTPGPAPGSAPGPTP